LLALLDIGAGPEVVTWPLLLAGLGVGALASQLGSVTVSAVPDEQSGEVGGIQNTGTNLRASIGTALARPGLLSALTTAFLPGLPPTPRGPPGSPRPGEGEAAGGAPFLAKKSPAAPARQGGCPPQDRRRDRQGERRRPHRRAALITGAARRHRADRAVRHPPDPRPAAGRGPGRRARGLTNQARVLSRSSRPPPPPSGGSAPRASWRMNDFGGCQTPRSSTDQA